MRHVQLVSNAQSTHQQHIVEKSKVHIIDTQSSVASLECTDINWAGQISVPRL